MKLAEQSDHEFQTKQTSNTMTYKIYHLIWF